MWGEVSPELGDTREAELRDQDMFFKPVLSLDARLLRHNNTLESAQYLIRLIMNHPPMALQIQHELVDQKLDLSRTAAGAELNRDLIEQVRKHQENLQNLQAEMEVALQSRDEETRKELEEEAQKLQLQMSRVQMDAERLASDYNQEKISLDGHILAMMEASQKDAERTAIEQQRQMNELKIRLQSTLSTSKADKYAMQRQLEGLQRSYDENLRRSG